MLVGAKVRDLAEDLLWFACGLYVGILTSSLNFFCKNDLPALDIVPTWSKSSAGN